MFRENFITIARANHLSLATEKSYWSKAKEFILWAKAKSAKDLEDRPTEKFRQFLSQMANANPDREEGDESVSASSQNLSFHAIRFLLEKVVGIELGDLSGIPRATGHGRLVDVPPHDIAKKIVLSVSGRPGTALRTILGTAGREKVDVLRMRIKDLDFRRNIIAFHQSKGGTARFVPMPKSLIPELKSLVSEATQLHETDLKAGLGWVHLPGNLAKKYPKYEKSTEWQYIFFSDTISQDPVTKNFGRHHLDPATIQRAFASAKIKNRITRPYTVHSLRHCAAQFWESKGVKISKIQELLGHRSVETTMGYLKSGQNRENNVPTPI